MKKQLLLLSSLFLLGSCSSSPEVVSSLTSISSSSESMVNVIFEEDDAYEMDSYVYSIPKGSDLEVTMTLFGKYAISAISYSGASTKMVDDSTASVFLPEIKYSTRVSFTFDEAETQFTYHLDGGKFYNGSGDEYTLFATTAYHLRPNLECGVDRFSKYGYSQIGWLDEDNNEIGLGSRYTIPNKKHVHFHPLYEKWNSTNDFYYKTVDGYAYVTGYKKSGNLEKLVIPASFGGIPLKGICRGFISDVEIGTLVIPISVDVIEEESFYNCDIQNLYLFDNIHEITDESFLSSVIEKVHILASHPSRGLYDDANCVFAEDMDRLILRKDKKKIVHFAGCSGSYSFNSKTMEQVYGDEYEICNMAVLGATNATAMLDCIIPFLGEGDLFIHAPEMMSEFQMMYNLEADNRFFTLYIGNYDLLTMADITIIPKFWTSFGEYVNLLDEREEETFNTRSKWYDEYGDYIEPRPNSRDDADYNITGVFPTQVVNQTSCGWLDSYYAKAEEQGAYPLYSFAVVNENAVNRLDPGRVAMHSYRSALDRFLHVPTIISSIEEAILPGRYFYDTDYHASEEGRDVRTAILIKDLNSYLGR